MKTEKNVAQFILNLCWTWEMGYANRHTKWPNHIISDLYRRGEWGTQQIHIILVASKQGCTSQRNSELQGLSYKLEKLKYCN